MLYLQTSVNLIVVENNLSFGLHRFVPIWSEKDSSAGSCRGYRLPTWGLSNLKVSRDEPDALVSGDQQDRTKNQTKTKKKTCFCF